MTWEEGPYTHLLSGASGKSLPWKEEEETETISQL